MIPAGILLPAWLTAEAQTVSTFDYYISPTGSDSNPGTLAQPWAITSLRTVSNNFRLINGAGKRIGLLPGTYNVSGLMVSDPVVGALQWPGGTSGSPNYYASCDASGVYSPRTATLNAKTAGGVYGGGVSRGPGTWDGPIVSHTGQYPSAYVTSNITIDGIVFRGSNYKALRIGGASAGDGPAGLTNVVVKNCEFTDNNANANGNPTDNCASVWIDGCVGAIVSNNYIHDNIGPSGSLSEDHLNAIIVWGKSSPITSGTVIQYNTCVNSGSIYGKEDGVQGTTIQNNYVDCSTYTGTSTAYGIQDFTGYSTGGLTQTTIIRHNIVLAPFLPVGGRSTLSDSGGFSTPVQVYNNTVVQNSNAGGQICGFWMNCLPGGAGGLKFYNNIISGSPGGFNGVFRLNPGGPAVWDYNLCASGQKWALCQNASLNSVMATYTNQTAFATGLSSNGGISNADSHSIFAAATFTGSGSLALRYQLASVSNGRNTGSTTGTPGGTPCDMGAWGNGATQIGCNFISGSSSSNPVPEPPSLTVT
jgi:hypothetical protein